MSPMWLHHLEVSGGGSALTREASQEVVERLLGALQKQLVAQESGIITTATDVLRLICVAVEDGEMRKMLFQKHGEVIVSHLIALMGSAEGNVKRNAGFASMAAIMTSCPGTYLSSPCLV